MPIHEYACVDCGTVFEVFPPDAPPPACRHCGGQLEKVMYSVTNWQWGDGRKKQ